MSLNRSLWVLTVILAPNSSGAQGITVQDAYTCADWAEARREDSSLFIESHLTGFFDGAAMGSSRNFWEIPSQLDPKQAFFWMDVYCENNPLSHVTTGAVKLLVERLGVGWNQ